MREQRHNSHRRKPLPDDRRSLGRARTYELPEPTAQLRTAKGHEAGHRGSAGQLHGLPLGRLHRHAAAGQRQGVLGSEVTKMIKVYHAPIDEADGKAIAAYLAEAY